MCKKISSFIVVLAAVLLALPSHAQTPKQRHFASADKKVTEVCVLKEGLKVDPVEMAKQVLHGTFLLLLMYSSLTMFTQHSMCLHLATTILMV